MTKLTKLSKRVEQIFDKIQQNPDKYENDK